MTIRVYEVSIRRVKPSQIYPKCGYQKKKSLFEGLHNYEKYHYRSNQDTAAAQVIENYIGGMERASRNAKPSSSTKCESPSQLGAKKPLYSTNSTKCLGVVHMSLISSSNLLVHH